MSNTTEKVQKNKTNYLGNMLDTDVDQRHFTFANATKNDEPSHIICNHKSFCGCCLDNGVLNKHSLSSMNSHFKGGLKKLPSKQDKVQHCKHIKDAKSPAPSVAHACVPKRQRTEEDDASTTSSNKSLNVTKKSKSAKKVEESLTVPQIVPVHQTPYPSAAELSDNLLAQCHPKTDDSVHLIKSPPFNDFVAKLTKSGHLNKKEKMKLAFGFWEDSKQSFWGLVEVGHGADWSPQHLNGLCNAECKKLKGVNLEKVCVIVAFFEKNPHKEPGDEKGYGCVNASSVKHASLRRVNTVNDLKKHKEDYFPLLNEEIKEVIKCSMPIVNELIDVNDLRKHKEVKEAFLGKDMKEL